MNKKKTIAIVVVALLLLGGIIYLGISLNNEKQINKEMQELAELDKKEMENEYQRFADQYSEMKNHINNDSIVSQLTEEQMKTQKLLEELRRVKSTDAREITRLKKELATMRKVLQTYVREIDSLNRLNQSLTEENTKIKGQYSEATRQIQGLSTEKANLSEKVAIAAQLNATNINMTLLNKKGRREKKLKKCKMLQVDFTVAKNVTAANGIRTFYVSIATPSGSVLNGGGTFAYENKHLTYTMKKSIEYSGQDSQLKLYWNVSQFLDAGTYRVSIFSEGNLIGSRTFTFK